MKIKSKSIFTGFVALAALASVSHAATVLEKDGFKYQIKGDWQVQLRQDPGVDQDLDVEYDDLEIKNAITYDLGNGISAFGELDFGFKNAAEKSDEDEGPHLEEAYVGLAYKPSEGALKKASIAVGQTGNAADEFGISKAIETVVSEDAFDDSGTLSGNDMIKVEADFGSVMLVASHELSADSEKSDEDGKFTDVFLGGELSGLAFGLAYQNFEAFGADDDINIMGISLSYDADVVEVAADYSDAEDDHTVINIVVAVPVGKTTELAAGYVITDFDEDGVDNVTGWYVNATYKFPAQKNVSVFAEIEQDDRDDSDMGYLAGVRLKF